MQLGHSGVVRLAAPVVVFIIYCPRMTIVIILKHALIIIALMNIELDKILFSQ